MERNKLILDECAQNILAKDLIIKEYQIKISQKDKLIK
jgi:hypothetical protein